MYNREVEAVVPEMKRQKKEAIKQLEASLGYLEDAELKIVENKIISLREDLKNLNEWYGKL